MDRTANLYLPESHVESLLNIEKGYWWYVARVRWASRFLESRCGKATTYVDLGAGTGGFAKELQSRYQFRQTYLVDNYPTQKNDDCKISNVRYLNYDLNAPLRLPASPQLVTCMDVLEHIERDQEFINQIYSNLHPKGLLILSVPAHQALYSEWDRQLGHFRRYNRTQIRHLLEHAGFRIHDIRYMWSPLALVAPYRKLKTKQYQTEVTFKPIPNWLNGSMLLYSDIEYYLPKWARLPFGTSVIAAATKNV